MKKFLKQINNIMIIWHQNMYVHTVEKESLVVGKFGELLFFSIWQKKFGK